MSSFFEYLTNIIYYLMFACVVGIFAPTGKYRKFVSLVVGFVLLLLMIKPFGGFFRDVPITEWFAGIPSVSASQESAHHIEGEKYLRGAFEAQLRAQLERLLSDFSIEAVSFEYANDFGEIFSVRLDVSEKILHESNTRVPFIRIEPPKIRTIQIGEPEPQICAASEKIKTLVSQFYNLPKEHISVIIY
ncbi:MAG: stage III sporulation protein AF [Defluviitaleaceae bacterium]|nr:stage III sporulation protein AF [Defluviitaleaceae bacterium]